MANLNVLLKASFGLHCRISGGSRPWTPAASSGFMQVSTVGNRGDSARGHRSAAARQGCGRILRRCSSSASLSRTRVLGTMEERFCIRCRAWSQVAYESPAQGLALGLAIGLLGKFGNVPAGVSQLEDTSSSTGCSIFGAPSAPSEVVVVAIGRAIRSKNSAAKQTQRVGLAIYTLSRSNACEAAPV